jgi:hypothetical protein
MRPTILLCIALVSAACHRQAHVGGPSDSRSVTTLTSADQLIAAMHDRYAGKWYRNITFIQKSSFLRPDGTPSRVETWYEAAAVPGRLRIDLGEPSKGNGVIYRADSVYQLQGGRVVNRQAGRNPLMILGFDVYGQPAARTLAQLRDEHIDITLLHMDTLYGRRVFVVGAGPTDSTSNQFWVDADRLLFVRLIQTNPENKRTQDIRFEKYVQHGGGWVAEEVRVLVGGRLAFHEEYSNVRVNVALDEGLFIPEKWSTATHWYKP